MRRGKSSAEEEKKNGKRKGRRRKREREEKKKKKRKKLGSVHQEARISKRRRVLAGENREWLSNLLHLRFVILVGLNF